MNAMLKGFIVIIMLIGVESRRRKPREDDDDEASEPKPCFHRFAERTWEGCAENPDRLQNDCWFDEDENPDNCQENLELSKDLYDLYVCAGLQQKWFTSSGTEAQNIKKIAEEFKGYAAKAGKSLQEEVYNAVEKCATHGMMYGDDVEMKIFQFLDCWLSDENRILQTKAFCRRRRRRQH
ncbi:uncharacterized protein LOC135167905 [Diachasmimorpha longicaudata]|uniref:uncharacterized protein LOC135167905 n=1 Tax=Diachasmimorpha longicaudata TaxID=58733 RepID=UPI0030B8A57E